METQNIQDDYEGVIIAITKWMQNLLSGWGVAEQWIVYVKIIVLLTITALMVYLLQFVVRRILTFVFQRIASMTPISFFKYTIKNRLPHFVALIVPYSFVRGTIPIIFYDFKILVKPFLKIVDIYLIFVVIWILIAIIKSFFDSLQEKPAFKSKPIKSYLQIIQIILAILGGVAIFSIISGKSATAIFAAMGAASAVMLLLFKDSLMGFVGSIQISTNDMVRIGDWITMNKYGADGNVTEINLTTVKVQNFDKTITTIPTYALISDSFQNWRGMQESGGRRSRKALYIKQSDIRFLSAEELDKYKSVAGLSQYIEDKQKEYGQRNTNADKSVLINNACLTNNDLFMQYALTYLRKHPKVNTDMTLMVRQLAPTVQGLPVEIYIFTNTTVWAEYETIMSEIINHLLSSIQFFDLHVFEESAGSDNYNVYMKG